MTSPSRIHLLTGENTYALGLEVRRWKAAFIEKYGDANLQTCDATALEWRSLLDDAAAAPFIAEKRLIVIDGVPTVTREDLETLEATMHEGTVIAFVDPKPDGRTSAVKHLMKNAVVRSFDLLSPAQLASWLQNFSSEHGCTLDTETANALIDVVGVDQWHLHHECLKLLTYASPGKPTKRDVDAVCVSTTRQTVWALSTLIAQGRSTRAALLSADLCRRGEDAFSLWNSYVWIIGNALQLWLWAQEGDVNPNALSKESGIPFLTIRTLLPFIRSLPRKHIKAMGRHIIDDEISLKTGGVKATSQDQIELLALLERSIVRLDPRYAS